MKFLYYVVSADGEVSGTNNPETAAEFGKNEDNVVIYTQAGSVLVYNEGKEIFDFLDIEAADEDEVEKD